MSWEATALISITRQSKATTALIKAGEPVDRGFHSPASKRDSRATLVRPAKVSAISSSPARSVLTQNTPLPRRIGMLVAPRLRQTSKVGGASDTEHTAVAVNPVLPAWPAVVMTCTAAPSRLIASRNVFCSTLL